MAKKRIRFVGLLLAAVMVLGMGAVSVAAEDNTDTTETAGITNLTELAAELNQSGSVTLANDVIAVANENEKVVKGQENITIDLGGKTLDATNCASRALPIVNAKSVTIKNGTVKAGTTKGNMLFVFRGTDKPTVTVENVEIDFRDVSARNVYTDLFGLGSGVAATFANCTVLVKDTEQLTLIEPFVTKAATITSAKIVLDAEHTFNDRDKVVKGNVYNKVEIDLGGNTLAVSGAQTARMIRFYNNAAVTIKNGSIKLNDNSSAILVVATGECKPTVTFDNVNFDFKGFTKDSGNKCAVLTNSVTPAQVNANCTMTVADLAQWKAAQNFAAKYKLDTFNAVLAEDITTNDVNDQFTVKGFKNVVINLNGKTFSVLDDNSARMIPVYDANSVVIKNGTVKLASAMGAMIVVDRDNSQNLSVKYDSVNFEFSDNKDNFNKLAYSAISNEVITPTMTNCTMPAVAVGDLDFDDALWKLEQKFARTYPIYGGMDTFNVVLSADTTAVTEKFAVTGFENVVIDLNGYTLKSANDDNAFRMMPITGAKNVTVKNGTISLNDTAKAGSMMFVFRNSTPDVSIEGVKIVRNEINTVKLFNGAKDVSYKAGCVVEKVIDDNSNISLTARAEDDWKENVGKFIIETSNLELADGTKIEGAGIIYNAGSKDVKLEAKKLANGDYYTDCEFALTATHHESNKIKVKAYVTIDGKIYYTDIIETSYNLLNGNAVEEG